METYKERDFKTNPEQWKVVVEYLERHPILIKSKFHHSDGDNMETKKLWRRLADHLNSMGFGARPVEKWQTAIGRWKSKTKAKASACRKQQLKTGGGPHTAPPLNPVEERLMAVLGWKSVVGDRNVELGLPLLAVMPPRPPETIVRPAETIVRPAETIVRPAETIVRPAETIVRPAETIVRPEGQIALLGDENIPPLAQIENRQIREPARATKKKLRTATEKTRKIVTLQKMNDQNREILVKIEQNTASMADSLKEISTDVKRFVDFFINK